MTIPDKTFQRGKERLWPFPFVEKYHEYKI